MCQEEAEARRPPVLILVQMVCDEGDLEEELDRVGGAQHLYRVLKPASLSLSEDSEVLAGWEPKDRPGGTHASCERQSCAGQTRRYPCVL